ncbi:ABC transporter substrate-binding protein [Arthrobacter sp. Soil763]|uniref:ABC transporter substrate-binding protein n=1 Tax=Arthrobacter sp. Soil763 TaxID=1736402 RepID=UPI000700FDBE|nr:extracellular solute-binding protein [Arthrobacter sp. Soil763]KRE79445.1 sugar ABC transporter substrate-binding protein [Arthrobacter sp. Soil763]
MGVPTKRLAVLAAAALGLAACGGGGQSAAETSDFKKEASGALTAWAFDNADDVGKARMKYAESQLSGVKITMDQTPFDAQKFTTRAASGGVPDVVQMDRTFVATYAAQGLIKPLDGCFKAHGMDPGKQFYPAVTQQVTYQDKVWAVPQFYQPAAIILNQSVLQPAGVSAEDIDTSDHTKLLGAVGKAYKASGGNPATLGFDPVAGGQAELWILGQGGRLMDDKGAPALDDPANIGALSFLKQLYDAQGGYAKAKSFSDSFDTFGKDNQFVKKQVGAQVDAQWYVNVLAPYSESLKISAVPFKDKEGKPFTVAGGTSFVIPTGAKNPDAACAWMTSLVTDDAWAAAGEARSQKIASTPGGINTGLFTGSPSADKLIRDKFVKPSGNAGFDETISTYYDVLPTGKSLGASPAGQTIKTELNNAIASALLGTKAPDKALADAQAAAKRAFDQAGS